MPNLFPVQINHSFSPMGRVKLGLLVLICAFLAGCASPDQQSGVASYGLFGPMSGNSNWQDTVDPISEYLARQQSTGIKINPDDINHPLAKQMLTQLGIRYRFGGKSPSTGFDCSGLVFYSAQESLGLKLPPRSDDMAKLGSNIERSDLKVGDLVFFNTMGRRYSHVGVYLGDSKFVHSPAAGGVVRVEDMTQRYWDKRFTGARRLEGIEVASASSTNDIIAPTLSVNKASDKPAPTNVTTNKNATQKTTTKTTVRTVTSKSNATSKTPPTKTDVPKSSSATGTNKSSSSTKAGTNDKVATSDKVVTSDKTASSKSNSNKSVAPKTKETTSTSQ